MIFFKKYIFLLLGCVYTRHVCVGAQKAEEGVGFTGAMSCST